MIERNGHHYITGKDLGFSREYVAQMMEGVDAICNAQSDAAYPIPETYEHAGMSQYTWMVGQSINAAANTLGMNASAEAIAAKAIAITNSIFTQLAKDNRV